ncbi:MAG: efflux RND transporter periplasmic adaptor subunit [Flavobacteriaceae bacterium]
MDTKKPKRILHAIGLSLLLVGCGDPGAQKGPQQGQALPFPVVSVPKKNVITYTNYPTTIEGKVNSEVRPKVSGYIQKVLVDEGQKVTKGQLLFQLETQSLSQDAEAAKAAVTAAEVEVAKLVPLVEKGIISNVQLETQKAKLAQAKSMYSSVLANIGYAQVKSPVNGYVGAIPYREGSLVSGSIVEPLTTVSETSEVFAYFSMNESDYLDFLQSVEGTTLEAKIAHFPKVKLQLANGKEYEEEGTIETVTGQINTRTGTVSFRAVFANPNHLLTNGNSGIIIIPKVYEQELVVPQEATFEQQGQVFVYTLNAENQVVASPISVKDQNKYLYIIDGGLSEGEKIVAKGVGKLRNKTPIQPMEMTFDSIVKPVKTLFQ